MKFVNSLPTKGENSFYTGNKPPLLPRPLIKLPPGKVKPNGWLKKQLELMADGFTGRLTELSGFCKSENNAWLHPNGIGEHGWEEVPYWLRGFIDLGYVLEDERIIKESLAWIEGILSSQRPDGYFGPQSNLENMDLWPNMVALYALRSFYEVTGDKRILSFMSRYFKWQMSVPFESLLHGSWQKVRGGDNLDSIYWLYNRTLEKWLLDAARVNHERTSDWTGGIASWHGVNFGQCFREPGQFYQQTGDICYLKATERNYDTMIGTYGQVPGGGFGADENARQGYTGPRQGTETCTWAELMWSHEMLGSITGDAKWFDRCEEIAFNSLPPSMTPDLKGLHYLTCPNQVQLDRTNKAPMIQNSGNMFAYDPYGFRCCQHNVGFAWPYFTEHLWMATLDNGLAAPMYSPGVVTARVGYGATVTITEHTDYPFSDVIEFHISTAKPVRFPFYLRIPEWCTNPQLKLNDNVLTPSGKADNWVVIERTWNDKDNLKLMLPMEVRIKTWEKNQNAVSVYRGPLIYSLKIGEKWERYGGTDAWPAYEVFPTTPWNYGLVIDKSNPSSSFKVVQECKTKANDQPFAPETAPIVLQAKGKRIPQWGLEENGLIEEVQPSPVKSNELVEDIFLIPMGCARLRITVFPVIGEGADAVEWK
ncbi:MAG: beta-L-arabinofuranosidase domain-containing protein [Armatimonadota bacterium]